MLLGPAVTRLLRIRSLYYELIAVAILGFAGTGAPLFGSLFFSDKFHLDVAGRSEVYAIIGLAAFLGLPVAYVVGDRYFRRAPQRPLVISGICISVYGILYVASLYVPSLGACVALQTLANAAVAPLAICIFLTLAATAPPEMRTICFAMFGVFSLVFGGLHRERAAGGGLRRRRAGCTASWWPSPSSGRSASLGGIFLVVGSRYVRARHHPGDRGRPRALRRGQAAGRRRGHPGPPGPQPRLLLRHQPGALRREPRGGRGRDGGPARDERGRASRRCCARCRGSSTPTAGSSASSGPTAPTSSPSRSSTSGWRCWWAGR